jgi:hypothetical protein
MKKKFHSKKFWSALALGMLVVTGGVFALPAIDQKTDAAGQTYLDFKQLQKDPIGFINSGNLLLDDDFDYIKELNNEFVKPLSNKSSVFSSGNKISIKDQDYPLLSDALKNLKEIPDKFALTSRGEFGISDIIKNLKKDDVGNI